ncbi:hypothetical protein A2972_03710 [Candidatus Amesbacteria bacterium RIFCSPLOWO2_01_FULL_47_33]|uniref:DNA ligase (ATP) n=1 Tax=Candidatus Amesbacteria bacterium RIFCSPLOWO2_01_FULL_47_33 TaxID=1797258 RepID=A0A1F4Z1Z1_9BACT|nr:MAG: hypothetical protein A2972_03710 [Candidatus Amesbacteria bacterium RIFCSPLOWO2_01_FULL_47_33]
MDFAGFSGYLEELEKTGSRLEMTRVLAQMFAKATPDEGKLMAYLSQGRLGPAYDNPNMGVADKQVVKAIQRLSEKDAGKLFREYGDLGLVAEKIKSQIPSLPAGRQVTKSQINHNIQTPKVHEMLMEIAKAGGLGSQEKKIQLIGDLLTRLEPKSAKYAVRIILGKLRTGFSDMTVLDSLSWMIAGDKSLRKDLEQIYNVRADLGEVVEKVKEYNSDKAIKLIKPEPEIGTPVLMARGERAASAREIWERTGQAAMEYKLDGLRIQAHIKSGKVNLFSRGLENVTEMYPDVVDGLEKQIKQECIVEGEMIAVGKNGKFLTFQETVQRKRKYNITEMVGKIPLKLYVFDILAADGKGYLDLPNDKRRELLEAALDTRKGDTVRLMPRKIAHGVTDIEKYFAEAIKDGTEGIFVKKLDSVYQAGSRNFNWIKYKKSYDKSTIADTIDAVVMGYDAGQGKRSGFGIGDFLIGVYEPKEDKYLTVAKIGTGLTDEEWREMKAQGSKYNVPSKPGNYEVSKLMGCDVWVKPKIVVEIKADEITKSPMHTSGYALRFPRLVGWREKQPEDATSVGEIIKLYQMQKK